MSRRLRTLRERLARHPASAAALQKLGVDLEQLTPDASEPRAPRRRPDPNPNADGPEDAAPHRRDYDRFERERN